MATRKRMSRDSGGSGKFRIASLEPDRDTRDLFGESMKDAERGEIIGAIVIKLYKRKEHGHKLYSLHLAGTAATSPTFAVGALVTCLDILRDFALKHAGLK